MRTQLLRLPRATNFSSLRSSARPFSISTIRRAAGDQDIPLKPSDTSTKEPPTATDQEKADIRNLPEKMEHGKKHGNGAMAPTDEKVEGKADQEKLQEREERSGSIGRQ